MFKTGIALDIGSRKTKIAICNQNTIPILGKKIGDEVHIEESCVAAHRGAGHNMEQVIAGNAALDLHTECVYPMREGCPANSRLLAILLRRLTMDISGRHNPNRIELHIAISRALGNMKLRNLERTMELSGFKSFHFHDAALMAARGAGLNITEEHASMIINIGAETIGAAVAANGGLLWESLIAGGSRCVNRAIITLLRRKYDLMIGERMAELIKLSLGSSDYIIDGRDSHTGMPRTICVGHKELDSVVDLAANEAVEVITDCVKALQPDAAADIADNGILLIGGGAKLNGLSDRIAERTALDIRVAPNADTAVIEGLKAYAASGKTREVEWDRGYLTQSMEEDYA